MKITKTYLRKRWADNNYVATLPFPLKESIESFNADKKFVGIDAKLLNDIDLRGISDDKLFFLRFHDSTNNNIDFSFGKGAISVHDTNLRQCKLQEFNFDRATYLTKSNIYECDFRKSKLIFTAEDIWFENCDFSETIFKGGFNEYGFRRCKFINCRFGYAAWKNTYFLACFFINCNFADFRISKSVIRGFKVDKLTSEINDIFIDCEIDGLIEIGDNHL